MFSTEHLLVKWSLTSYCVVQLTCWAQHSIKKAHTNKCSLHVADLGQFIYVSNLNIYIYIYESTSTVDPALSHKSL